jgi:hypothetical protein
MKNPKFDYLLTIFFSNDKLRKALMHPIPAENYVYATDAHSAIKIQKKLLVFSYNQIENAPDVESVISPVYSEKEITFNAIHVQDLTHILSQSRIGYTKQMCEVCDGDGTVVCSSCSNEHDCKSCSGSGVSNCVYPVRITYSTSECTVFLFDGKFSPHLLERVLIAAFALNAQNIEIRSIGQKFLFTIKGDEGCVEILIMGKL